MAMKNFRFGAMPIPPSEYNPEHLRQAFRVLELYFSQLDSTTPLQNNSYTGEDFYGGTFHGNFTGGDSTFDTATISLLNAITANINLATVQNLYSDYAEIKSLLSNRIASYDVMANNFYGGVFNGDGYELKLPHVCASDSTTQVAGGNDTPTLVNFNTLDSGYGWTLNSPGSATADYDGVYKITYSLEFINTDNAQHEVTVWLKVNSNNVSNSSTVFTVPARKSVSIPGYVCAYSEISFVVNAGDEVELYWATNLAGDPTTPTAGVYMFFEAAQTVPYAHPAVPSALGSITLLSALNKTKVTPLPVFGVGQTGTVSVLTNLG